MGRKAKKVTSVALDPPHGQQATPRQRMESLETPISPPTMTEEPAPTARVSTPIAVASASKTAQQPTASPSSTQGTPEVPVTPPAGVKAEGTSTQRRNFTISEDLAILRLVVNDNPEKAKYGCHASSWNHLTAKVRWLSCRIFVCCCKRLILSV